VSFCFLTWIWRAGPVIIFDCIVIALAMICSRQQFDTLTITATLKNWLMVRNMSSMTYLKVWSTVFPYSDRSFCNWTQNLFWAFFTSLTVERNNCWSYAQPFASPAFSCSYLDTRTICMTTHWPCWPATPSTLWAFFVCNWSKIIYGTVSFFP